MTRDEERRPGGGGAVNRQGSGFDIESTALYRLGDDVELLAAAPRVVDLVSPCVRYGRDYPDTDLWLDRDGRVHRGDGPYVHRPLRGLRRALGRWLR